MAQLRLARKVKQADAALRAGLSRNTVYRQEKGDPGIALGQVLRYLAAISPGITLLDLLAEKDPALLALSARPDVVSTENRGIKTYRLSYVLTRKSIFVVKTRPPPDSSS